MLYIPGKTNLVARTHILPGFMAKNEKTRRLSGMERDTGIEPVFFAWEANVLPLN